MDSISNFGEIDGLDRPVYSSFIETELRNDPMIMPGH